MAYSKHTFTAGQVLTAAVMTQIDTELKNVSDKEESLENDFAILKADCESSQAITENRVDALVTGSQYTEYGVKAVAKGTFSYHIEIDVYPGNDTSKKKTYTGTTAPVKAGDTFVLKVVGAPEGTTYKWQYDSNGTWQDSVAGQGYNTANVTYTAFGTNVKRIGYKYRCVMNGMYVSDVIILMDTSWKNVAPSCSVDGAVVSVTQHYLAVAPDGLCYDVRVNGESKGTIEWNKTASERTLTLTTAPGENDLVEVVPFVSRGTDTVSTIMEVSD